MRHTVTLVVAASLTLAAAPAYAGAGPKKACTTLGPGKSKVTSVCPTSPPRVTTIDEPSRRGRPAVKKQVRSWPAWSGDKKGEESEFDYELHTKNNKAAHCFSAAECKSLFHSLDNDGRTAMDEGAALGIIELLVDMDFDRLYLTELSTQQLADLWDGSGNGPPAWALALARQAAQTRARLATLEQRVNLYHEGPRRPVPPPKASPVPRRDGRLPAPRVAKRDTEQATVAVLDWR